MADGAASAGEGRPTDVPPQHICAHCGYPSGASGSAVCPECGRGATRDEIEAEARRREVVARWKGEGRARAIARWALISGAYAVGLAAVTRSAGAGLLGGSALACVLTLSWWMGTWGLLRASAERRAYLEFVWRSGLWVLHLPWLVAPVFVVVAVLVGLVDRWAGDPRDGAYERVLPFGLGLWLLGCFGAFGGWWELRRRAVARGGYRLARADAVAFVLGLVVIVIAAGLGFAGGVCVGLGVAEWLRLPDFLWG